MLRYEAVLSDARSAVSRVETLRGQLQGALDASTEVRLIVVTPATGRTPNRIHVRSDLVGKVVQFDGETYIVDFTRPAPPTVEPKARRRR